MFYLEYPSLLPVSPSPNIPIRSVINPRKVENMYQLTHRVRGLFRHSGNTHGRSVGRSDALAYWLCFIFCFTTIPVTFPEYYYRRSQGYVGMGGPWQQCDCRAVWWYQEEGRAFFFVEKIPKIKTKDSPIRNCRWVSNNKMCENFRSRFHPDRLQVDLVWTLTPSRYSMRYYLVWHMLKCRMCWPWTVIWMFFPLAEIEGKKKKRKIATMPYLRLKSPLHLYMVCTVQTGWRSSAILIS